MNNRTPSSLTPFALLLAAILSLSGCGGGGGDNGSGTTPPPPPPPQPGPGPGPDPDPDPGTDPDDDEETVTAKAAVQGDEHYELTTVVLDATGSVSESEEDLTYFWLQTGGRSVMLDDAMSATPSFVVPKLDGHEEFTFQLVVSSGDAADSDEITLLALENSFVVYHGRLDEDAPDSDRIYLAPLHGNGEKMLLTEDEGRVLEFAVSPDNRRVAFLLDYETGGDIHSAIYVGEIGAGSAERIDDGAGMQWITQLRWSPDGTHIAFRAKRDDGAENLYLVPADGDERTDLTRLGADDSNDDGTPDRAITETWAWSPSGNHIAYLERVDDGAHPSYTRLYTVIADASAAPVMVSDFEINEIHNQMLYDPPAPAPVTLALADFALAPLAIVADEDCADSDVDCDGTPDGSVHSFAWSPSGEQLLYIADAGVINVNELFVVNVDGSGFEQLTTISTDGTLNETTRVITSATAFGGGDVMPQGDVNSAAWSPTGESIAFRGVLSMDEGVLDTREYLVRANGQNLRTPEPFMHQSRVAGFNAAYAWSPDGTYLAFVAGRTGTTNLFVAEDTFLTPVTSLTFQAIMPPILDGNGNVDHNLDRFDWLPDGRLLILSDLTLDEDDNPVMGLWLASPEVADTVTAVPGALSPFSTYWLAKNGSVVVFDGADGELHASPLLGEGSDVRVSAECVRGGECPNVLLDVQVAPNGRKTAYTFVDVDGGPTRLVIADTVDGTHRELTSGPDFALGGIDDFEVFGPAE